MYCRGAAALVLVFDIASAESFRECHEWVQHFAQTDTRDTKIVCLVANKIDLNPAISIDDVKEFATSIHAEFFATSAKTGEQIDSLFEKIAGTLTEAAMQNVRTVNISARRKSRTADDHGEKSKRCC
jgi:GTPase SAR1 family protein